jgi:folate-binding protein YgfZ
VLCVEGADAPRFLQGLVSCDVARAGAAHTLLGALLTPQGRFLFDFLLLRHGEEYWLDTHADGAETLLKKLALYRLRAAVTLSLRPELRVAAYFGAALPVLPAGIVAARDTRHASMGWRLYGAAEALDSLPCTPESDHIYAKRRLALALPEGAQDAEPEKTLLLEMGYERMGGVDFAKGCYIGQEVTARTRHRGTLRKYLYSVQGDAPLPSFGAPLLAGGEEIGRMRSSCGGIGLALMHRDRLLAARQRGEKIEAEEHPVMVSVPWWQEAVSSE